MKNDPTLLRCSLCKIERGAAPRTDRLWLKTLGHRDYLVCHFHKEGNMHVKTKKEIEYDN